MYCIAFIVFWTLSSNFLISMELPTFAKTYQKNNSTESNELRPQFASIKALLDRYTKAVQEGHEIDACICVHEIKNARDSFSYWQWCARLFLFNKAEREILAELHDYSPHHPVHLTNCGGCILCNIFRMLKKCNDPYKIRDLIGQFNKIHDISNFLRRSLNQEHNLIQLNESSQCYQGFLISGIDPLPSHTLTRSLRWYAYLPKIAEIIILHDPQSCNKHHLLQLLFEMDSFEERKNNKITERNHPNQNSIKKTLSDLRTNLYQTLKTKSAIPLEIVHNYLDYKEENGTKYPKRQLPWLLELEPHTYTVHAGKTALDTLLHQIVEPKAPLDPSMFENFIALSQKKAIFTYDYRLPLQEKLKTINTDSQLPDKDEQKTQHTQLQVILCSLYPDEQI